MKVIKNDYVDMKWDAEGFYESKKNGFVGAVWIYGEGDDARPVCFHNGKAFLLVDEDGYCSRDTIEDALREANNGVEDIEDMFEEYYVDLGNLSYLNDDVLEMHGLSEYAEDIEARLDDLSCYWETVEEDMA